MFARQAVVLVGGKGTRLGDLTRETPKPLLEIADGFRFLDMLIFNLARSQFTDILLLAGYLGEQVEDAYHERQVLGAKLRVIREPEPQGTGGALAYARDQLDPWFLMTNGDSLFEFNYRDLTNKPPAKALGRIALREVDDPSRYGRVETSGTLVTAFREKSASGAGPANINGGVYFLSRDVLDYIDGPCSIESDVFPKLAANTLLEASPYQGYFLDIGLPDTFAQAQREIPPRLRRPCAFLDRDGVLNVDEGYTHRPEDLKWIDGAPETVRLLNDAGYYVIVVSNQAGVARGYYDEAAVDAFHAHMTEQLGAHGAHIDAFYYCPHHPQAVTDEYRHPSHPDRKPNPGMLTRAMADFDIDKQNTFLIGDTDSDLAAATAAGISSHHFTGGNLREFLAANVELKGALR